METHIHTPEELNGCLHKRLKDELADVETYGNLYESFKANGMHAEAKLMEMIAREEYGHAETIREILEEHNRDLEGDGELKTLWHKAHVAFELE